MIVDEPSSDFRTELDSLGEVRVPKRRYWGAQTERSRLNFPIGREPMPREVIYALATVKKACAQANLACGVLPANKVRAIEEVAKGGVYLSPRVSQVIVEASLGRREIDADPLTPREREILQLIAEGSATKQVAAQLGISVKTAESHRARIMKKLDVHEVAGLVRYAIRQGLVEA